MDVQAAVLLLAAGLIHQEVDAVTVFAEDEFILEFQHVRIVAQFDLHGAGRGFVPVDAAFGGMMAINAVVHREPFHSDLAR